MLFLKSFRRKKVLDPVTKIAIEAWLKGKIAKVNHRGRNLLSLEEKLQEALSRLEDGHYEEARLKIRKYQATYRQIENKKGDLNPRQTAEDQLFTDWLDKLEKL